MQTPFDARCGARHRVPATANGRVARLTLWLWLTAALPVVHPRDGLAGSVPPGFVTPVANPFGLANVGSDAVPRFADIDGDGDLDAFVGAADGSIRFFGNTGTATSPAFASPLLDPFGLTDVGAEAKPSFADLDRDGDLDALVGESAGHTEFFLNTGTGTSAAFAAPSSDAFGLAGVAGPSSPTLVDLDGDGDFDALIGDGQGQLSFFRSTLTATVAAFATPSIGSFGLVAVSGAAASAFADMDGDGDLDAFVGALDGHTRFSPNTGSATNPAFGTPSVDPFGLAMVSGGSAPTLVDIDGDGHPDAFTGTSEGDTIFFRNTQSQRPTPLFALPVTSPFGVVENVVDHPSFADIDADGDLDLIAGGEAKKVRWFRNTGTATNPRFAPSQLDPYHQGSAKHAAPTFADIDDDGDLDSFVGSTAWTIFNENTGVATFPQFTSPWSSIDPFGFPEAGESVPALADIDGDGDLDGVVGGEYGNLRVTLNTGTAVSPAFALPFTNPFGLTNVGERAAPALADFDQDGDLDAFVGNADKDVYFFRNSGSAVSPSFAPPVVNPFGLVRVTPISWYAAPQLVDIDGDGDLDLFESDGYGRLVLVRNLTSQELFLDDFETGDTSAWSNGSD